MSRAGPVRRAGSFSPDPGTSEKNTKNQVCDYMEKSQSGSPGSRHRNVGISANPSKFFHVIAFTGTARLAGRASDFLPCYSHDIF